MRFAKLRLSGFKSFVEPAELHIRDGLTGVVGPNGCGKSNLLEALRWVMGESSARSLRVAAGGAGMDDVIFAGTAKRARRDLAEVRLTLDNSARRAPAEFNADEQLEVSRSIVRGEGSNYALNGRDVRLKDVQLLFADAATGAHSPALVSQGRVAAIIAARPQERRQLLEEAAGISGLNVRRREAEQRLRAADANLLRLDDVMKTAEAQASGLRRQARSAARYRELSDRIRILEAALMRLQWASAVEALQVSERALAEADAQLQRSVQEAARSSTAQASAAASLPSKRLAESVAAAALQRLTTERATLVAERAALVRRLQDIETALTNAATDMEREEARAKDSATTQQRLAEELEGQRRAEQGAQAMVAPQAAQVRATEMETSDAERALATAVEAHAALVAEARGVRAQADAARTRADRLAAERQRLEAELARLKTSGDADGLDARIAEAGAALAAKGAEADAASAAIAVAERDALAARQASEAVERALLAARAEVAGLEAEAAALERLRGARQTLPLAARASLSARPGYEAAAAAALGDDLNAALGAPPKPGRYWLNVGVPVGDAPLPANCAPLDAQVSGPAELSRRLAQIGVVDAPPDAAMIAALKPGQRLVSRDGWMWRWDGFVVPPGGSATAVAEALAQDNRRIEIADNLLAPRARLAAADTELAQQKAALGAAQAAERHARTARTEAERAREQLAGRMQGLRAAQAQAVARASAMEASVERLAAEGESATAEAESAALAVTRLPDASVAAEQVGNARSAAERARAHLAQARAQAAALERSLAEATARITRLSREIADWQARDRDAAASRAAMADRVARLTAERASLVAEPAALDARLELLDRGIHDAESQRTEAAETVMAAELAIADLDREAKAAQARVADGREARATHAARASQHREKVVELAAESAGRFGRPPQELDAADGADAATVDSALASVLAERERIGIVNLRADIELAEIESVLGEQQRERQELETAINRLRGSIGTLNREGRARLMAAFAEVDRHFRELFVTLFGGGTAELQLVESDDPLESGLEIRAQPPGKKLQSLSLLSGGEQALTAIALIFALFRTNPAPICVLDEVDAPLDDANVERFTRLLGHMAETTDTRFLIVTHNAVTMAAMHRLYGVTMAEPGVSQLVSVELREAERLAAA